MANYSALVMHALHYTPQHSMVCTMHTLNWPRKHAKCTVLKSYCVAQNSQKYNDITK